MFYSLADCCSLAIKLLYASILIGGDRRTRTSDNRLASHHKLQLEALTSLIFTLPTLYPTELYPHIKDMLEELSYVAIFIFLNVMDCLSSLSIR